MKVPLPGACLREATVSAVIGLASSARPWPEGAADRSRIEPSGQVAAFVMVSAAASTLSMPSILRTMGLGLTMSIPDVLLIALGLVLAAEAWRVRSVWGFALQAAYAALLVFAAPLALVRAMA